MEQIEPAPDVSPPAHPDDWSDEQWIAWLKATDAEVADHLARSPASFAGRVVHSTSGQVLGQSMMGLAQAIYGPRDPEVVIVAEAPSEPEEDRAFAVHLNADHPEQSVVVVNRNSGPGAR